MRAVFWLLLLCFGCLFLGLKFILFLIICFVVMLFLVFKYPEWFGC